MVSYARALVMLCAVGCSNSGGGSNNIQCGPNLVCASGTTCSIPVSGNTADYSNPSCLPFGTDAGSTSTKLECSDNSTCAPDQICCANYQQPYPRSMCDVKAPGKCNSANDPLARWCASSSECDAPQTCLTDKTYPWVKSCQ